MTYHDVAAWIATALAFATVAQITAFSTVWPW